MGVYGYPYVCVCGGMCADVPFKDPFKAHLIASNFPPARTEGKSLRVKALFASGDFGC